MVKKCPFLQPRFIGPSFLPGWMRAPVASVDSTAQVVRASSSMAVTTVAPRVLPSCSM